MAFCDKAALEHFAKYTGKNLRWSFSLEKLQAVKNFYCYSLQSNIPGALTPS